jgi:hypothetical protein
MASEARRQKRLQDRQSKKLFNQIRIETLKKMATLTAEEKLVLAQEYKDFLKRMENGM